MDTQDWFVKSRPHLGQIVAGSIDSAKGTCSVITLDGYGTQPYENLELPTIACSISRIKGFGSSWIRYMPQDNDFVLLAFGPNSEPRIVGYASFPSREGAPGYNEQITTMKAQRASEVPYADLTELKNGELDMRSSGGAYLHLSNRGSLLLSGGPRVNLRLNKSRNETRGESGLWVLGSGGSFIRCGDVKRKPTPANYVEIQTDLTSSTKEAWTHIESLPGLWVYDEKAGAVYDALALPEVSTYGLPLRHKRTIWTTGSNSLAATAAWTSHTDLAGNQETLFGATATNATVTGPALNADLSCATLRTTTTGTTTLSSTGAFVAASGATMHLDAVGAMNVAGEASVSISSPAATTMTAGTVATIAAPSVCIGAGATERMIRGDSFVAALQAFLTLSATQYEALAAGAFGDDATYFTTLAAAAGTLAGALESTLAIHGKVL